MAAAGLNVVLISRTPAKLKAVAEEISNLEYLKEVFKNSQKKTRIYLISEAQYSSIEIKTIAVDFTEGQSIYPKLRTELNQIKIGILVNNVGMLIGFDQFGNLEDDRELHNIINCNILSMVIELLFKIISKFIFA